MMRQPGKSRLFCVCGKRVAGVGHHAVSRAGAEMLLFPLLHIIDAMRFYNLRSCLIGSYV
jgi:hypothetical protein